MAVHVSLSHTAEREPPEGGNWFLLALESDIAPGTENMATLL